MISHKHKVIFVHIPKCGGVSMEGVLFKPRQRRSKKYLFGSPNKYQTGGLQHLMSSHIIEEVGEDIFNQYFKFSFVRNPWDKMVLSTIILLQNEKTYRITLVLLNLHHLKNIYTMCSSQKFMYNGINNISFFT